VKQGDTMTLRVRRETLFLLAIAAILLFGGAYYWGLRRGEAMTRSALDVPPVELGEVKALTPPVRKKSAPTPSRPARAGQPARPAASPTGPSHSVRVMTCENNASGRDWAKGVEEFLVKRGYPAFTTASGRHRVVLVGRYASAADPEMLRVMKEVRKLRYNRRLLFDGAYVVRSPKSR
jgi:hypothetical protein